MLLIYQVMILKMSVCFVCIYRIGRSLIRPLQEILNELPIATLKLELLGFKLKRKGSRLLSKLLAVSVLLLSDSMVFPLLSTPPRLVTLIAT